MLYGSVTLTYTLDARLAYIDSVYVRYVPQPVGTPSSDTLLITSRPAGSRIDLDTRPLPSGAGTLMLTGRARFGASSPVRLLALGSWPAYVETAAPALSDLRVAVENGFVTLRWWDSPHDHLPRSSAGAWVDSAYVGGKPTYSLRLATPLGDATAYLRHEERSEDLHPGSLAQTY